MDFDTYSSEKWEKAWEKMDELIAPYLKRELDNMMKKYEETGVFKIPDKRDGHEREDLMKYIT